MSNMSVDQVLSQMRVLSQKGVVPESRVNGNTDFSSLLSESINKVNTIQQEASTLKTAFETGNENVDLSEVMVQVQKASLSFEAITEVRNKLLNAYQEVMNMQV